MDLILKERLVVNLCAADINCGYISATPVLDNRDELIAQQCSYYRDLLAELEILLTPESVGTGLKPQDEQWRSAIELVTADILCGSISLNPILYDRAEKIRERIIFYFSNLNKFFAIEQQESVKTTVTQEVAINTSEDPQGQAMTPALTEVKMTEVNTPAMPPAKSGKGTSKPVRKKNKRKKK
ncbi:hypothetical protein [Citrobacter rodentium]|jgi:hypothetical protein|uniref:Uncharacterized protein n=2 Tax=Citrobacter rodentium TaxID=67825 RepID=D2TIU0_CITRI|nr:hypothetical protein [Citrobacter rodentium]KIQ50981.1 hypothetical protein TA05_12835 [Citrobacter rodentium]QBY30444.1 hypothetical protein E2R62_17495 [Citrobacter rodentium]UHO32186.1 hypothetical protein K7R23_05665 [Citrobacter rodentium NBRC 105723 = DSM 16636]CBG90850.1 hypothetical protein ROD_41511 [Citrobacter rodentium ICC168]HAT8012638.1 hypothetical protein [Citrobacter rodentium NBRC 105723 = DSM 16636]